jgi:hypothetical protein
MILFQKIVFGFGNVTKVERCCTGGKELFFGSGTKKKQLFTFSKVVGGDKKKVRLDCSCRF